MKKVRKPTKYLYLCKNCGQFAGTITCNNGLCSFYCSECHSVISEQTYFYSQAEAFIKSFKVVIK